MSRSFTPRGRGAPRGGGDRGRGGYGGRGGGRGGFQRSFDQGPPAEVLEMGTFVHAVEGEMLCASSNAAKVPYFNAPIYLENKSSIGKVDEILGPINEVYFTIKPQEGIVAGSFKKGDKVYIGGDKLLPLDRFIPKPKMAGPKPPKKKGTRGGPGRIPGGGGRGGRGGGRGSFRGAPRGRGGFGGDRGRGGFGRGAPRGRGGGGFRGRGRGS